MKVKVIVYCDGEGYCVVEVKVEVIEYCEGEGYCVLWR